MTFEHLLVHAALTRLGLRGLVVQWLHPVERTPAGNYAIRVRLSPDCDLRAMENSTGSLAIALNADEVRWERSGPRVMRLWVRKPLPAELPRYPDAPVPLTPAPAQGVPLGVDADGHPATLSLFDAAGGTVTLVAGNPGSGKSSALSLVAVGLAPTSAHVVWFDPKGGADAAQHGSRVLAVTDAANPDSAKAELEALLNLAMGRANALGRGLDISFCRPVVVVVDEWAILGASGDRKTRAEVESMLRWLTQTGRAANISVILATQRPTTENIDVTTRSLAGNRICFAVGDRHASIAALDVEGAEALDVVRDRGRAIVRAQGQQRLVRMYRVPDDRRERLAAWAGLRTSTSDVAAWDAVSFREQMSAG